MRWRGFIPLVMLTACGEIAGGPDLDALDILPTDTTVQVGEAFELRAVARDGDGRILADWPVQWTVENETVLRRDGDRFIALAPGGPVVVTARAGDQAAVSQVSVRSAQRFPAVIEEMFGRLGVEIEAALLASRGMLPLNPTIEQEIRAKIALLERPTLATEIIDGGFFALDSVRSLDGRMVAVPAVFAEAHMRADADAAVQHVTRTITVLENFLQLPFPHPHLRLWIGFKLGGTGGLGTMTVEDRSGYERRPPAVKQLYELTLVHEAAHSYFSNESIAQFLELYGQNLLAGLGADPAHWTHRRQWQPQLADNRDVHALLDIYQLIGPAAMSAALRASRPLGTRYGEPLSADVQLKFIDAAPADVRAQVAIKIARVYF